MVNILKYIVRQQFVCNYCLVVLTIISAVKAVPLPSPQEDVEAEVVSAGEGDDSISTGTQKPLETTTPLFISYLFQREGVRDPWVAQLVKAVAPVLAEEGIGGVIRQSFKVGPALALGAFNGLANQRISSLLNFPSVPTTTLIPPYKRYRESS